MIFKIKNETGSAITLGGTSYATNSWVDIVPYVNYQGVNFTRNDVDGPNAGRAQDGSMIRDRVATKGKWEVEVVSNIAKADLLAIYSLVYPETFSIQTDIPYSGTNTFTVYTNNIPVQFAMRKSDGTEHYMGVKIPFVEV